MSSPDRSAARFHVPVESEKASAEEPSRLIGAPGSTDPRREGHGVTGAPATYKLAERGQYICPGSIFIPLADGRCLCGHPREAHVWESAGGAGAFRRIEEEAVNPYANA